MVSPDQERDDGDGDARERHEAVTEDTFLRERGDEFTDHAHRRQDHDVDRRMGVKPEQVLEEDRIAAYRRIEDAYVEAALDGHQAQGDGKHRRPEDLNDAGGVDRPEEE